MSLSSTGALLFYFVGGVILHHTHGHFHPLFLLALALFFVIFAVAALRRSPPDARDPAASRVNLALATVLVVFVYITWVYATPVTVPVKGVVRTILNPFLQPVLEGAASSPLLPLLHVVTTIGLALSLGLWCYEVFQPKPSGRLHALASAVLV